MSLQMRRLVQPSPSAPLGGKPATAIRQSSPGPLSPSSPDGTSVTQGPKMSMVKLGEFSGDSGGYPRPDAGSRASSLNPGAQVVPKGVPLVRPRAVMPTPGGAGDVKDKQESINESLKSAISALEAKLEAVTQKVDASVVQLEGRIAGLMETRGEMLEQNTDSPSAQEQLLGGGSAVVPTGMADATVKQLEGSIQGLLASSVEQRAEVERMGALVRGEIDDIRKRQGELLANDFEERLQLLQAQADELRNSTLEAKSGGASSDDVAASGIVLVRDLKVQVEELQAQSSTMQSNLQKAALALQDEARLRAEEDQRVEQLCTRATSAADAPSSMTVAAASAAPLTAELETRLDKVEARISTFASSQMMEEIARVERMCAQIEAANLEARHEAEEMQSHVVQLRGQVLALEAQTEGVREQVAETLRTNDDDLSYVGSVGQEKLEEVQDEVVALRSLEGEIKRVSDESFSMQTQIENAAKDFLWCRMNTDKMLTESKLLEERLTALQVSTTEAHLQLDAAIQGSIAAAQNDSQALSEEMEQLRAQCAKMDGGQDVQQLQNTLAELHDRGLSSSADFATKHDQLSAQYDLLNLEAISWREKHQELASLQQAHENLSARVDRVAEGDTSTARFEATNAEATNARFDAFEKLLKEASDTSLRTSQDFLSLRLDFDKANARMESLMDAEAAKLRFEAIENSVQETQTVVQRTSQALGEELRGRMDSLQDDSQKLRSQHESAVVQRGLVSEEADQDMRGQLEAMKSETKDAFKLMETLEEDLRARMEASEKSRALVQEAHENKQDQIRALCDELLAEQAEQKSEAQRLRKSVDDLQSQCENSLRLHAQEVQSRAVEDGSKPVEDTASLAVVEQFQSRMAAMQEEERRLRTSELAKISADTMEVRGVADSALQLVGELQGRTSALQAQSDAMRDQLAETMREVGAGEDSGDAQEKIDALRAGVESLIGDHVETRENMQQALNFAQESQNNCLQIMNRLPDESAGELCTASQMETVIIQLSQKMAEQRVEWQAALEAEQQASNGRAQVLGRALGEEFARSTASQAVVQARVEMQSMLKEELEKLQANGGLAAPTPTLSSIGDITTPQQASQVEQAITSVVQTLSSKVDSLHNEVRAEIDRTTAPVRMEIDVVRSLQQLSTSSLEAVQERLQGLEGQFADRLVLSQQQLLNGGQIDMDANIKAGLQEMFQEIQAHAVKLDQLQHELVIMTQERDTGLQALSDHVVCHISSLVSKLNERDSVQVQTLTDEAFPFPVAPNSSRVNVAEGYFQSSQSHASSERLPQALVQDYLTSSVPSYADDASDRGYGVSGSAVSQLVQTPALSSGLPVVRTQGGSFVQGSPPPVAPGSVRTPIGGQAAPMAARQAGGSMRVSNATQVRVMRAGT